MKFIRYPQKTPLNQPSVITIGNFDGIHIGHQTLIKKVTDLANSKNLVSVVVSMHPLASQYFAGRENVAILTPFKCKFHLLDQLKVDIFCALNFNYQLSQFSPDEFIQKILLDGLQAQCIVVGDDFRFGKNRVGDFDYLKVYCQKRGVLVEHIDTVSMQNVRISSSTIRKQLAMSHFGTVNSYLGRRYSIAGRISRGKQLGRELGFPTININLHHRVLPIAGIFCVKVKFDNAEIYSGSASIGTRPSVNGIGNVLEVHILDFNKQVYGQNVEVFFYHKIRNEVKFDSLSELKRHINEDVIKTRLYFKNKQQ
jgi:riboflavin kinase/FMN adenylyltransferase